MDGWNGPYYGFQEVHLTLGHGERCYASGGHYGKWVHDRFGEFDNLGRAHATVPTISDVACWPSNLPVEAHHSTWVADRALEFLKKQADDESPFFLFVSFPDPHAPFTPPQSRAEMFVGDNLPGPYRLEGENDAKPIHYQRAMHEKQHDKDGCAWRPPGLTDEMLRRIMAYYYASVGLIDHNVGRVIEFLDKAELDETTTVVFT